MNSLVRPLERLVPSFGFYLESSQYVARTVNTEEIFHLIEFPAIFYLWGSSSFVAYALFRLLQRLKAR